MKIVNPEINRFLRAQDGVDIYYHRSVLSDWDCDTVHAKVWITPACPVGAIPCGQVAYMFDDAGQAFALPYFDYGTGLCHGAILYGNDAAISAGVFPTGFFDSLQFNDPSKKRLELITLYHW